MQLSSNIKNIEDFIVTGSFKKYEYNVRVQVCIITTSLIHNGCFGQTNNI